MPSDPSPLLGPEDPPPFNWVVRAPEKRILLINDHAGFRTPAGLGDLGLSAEHWTKHIVGDWGMFDLGRDLVKRLDASLIEGVYSRAVLDLNRRPTDWDMAGPELDGVPVPANQNLSDADYAARIAAIHQPYHAQIERFLDEQEQPDRILVHCHSFTPALMSRPEEQRPWEIGLLHYNAADRADEALDWLRRNTDYQVGDNEPYSLFDRMTGSYALHSLNRAAPAITFEIRQDLITNETEVAHWGQLLDSLIREVF